jgi:hypothetical protein
MSHRAVPLRERGGLTDDLVRLSLGIEDAQDLAQDLALALSGNPASTSAAFAKVGRRDSSDFPGAHP